MKLYNGGKIITGLVIFVVLAGFPVLYNVTVGESASRPELVLPDPASHPNCVAPVEEMRSAHMDLLDEWRTLVVRDGERTYTSPVDGQEYDMSLSGTCLDCHAKKSEFCDRCHTYLGVDPYCWDCHVVPEELGIKN